MPILGALGSVNPRSLSTGSSVDPLFNSTVALIGTTDFNYFNWTNLIDNTVENQTANDLVAADAVFSQFSPYGYGWSVQIDGSSTITAPAGLVTAFAGWGGRRRSWDCWIYRSNTTNAVLVKAYQAVVQNGRWYILCSTTNKLQFGWTISTGSETSVQTTASIPTGWSYLTVCVDSLSSTNTTVYLGINGVVETFTGNNLSTQTTSYGWDAFFDTSQFLPPRFNGYFTGMRFSDNLRYTSNFTVPTSPHDNDANTLFLYGQTKTWQEQSSNTYTVARTGSPNVQPFSPFRLSGEYSRTLTGDSIFFPNSGYATVTPYSTPWIGNITQTDFTIEAWIYRRTVGTIDSILTWMPASSTTQGWYLRIETTNVVRFQYVGGSSLLGLITVQPFCWNHIAVTRSGSTARIYLNGAIDVTSNTFANGTTPSSVLGTELKIGADSTNTNPLSGYLTGIRICANQSLATGVFSPPTQPVTATSVGWTGANVSASIDSANVVLVTHFGVSAVREFTGRHTLSASGRLPSATVRVINTAPALPWGSTRAIEFNPAGEYFGLQGLNGSSFNFGTAPFTVEMWVYVVDLTVTRTLMDTNTAADATGTGRLLIRINNNGSIGVYKLTGTLILGTAAGTVVVNAWTHIAVSRLTDSTLIIHRNGNQVGAVASVTDNFSDKAEGRPLFGVNAFNATSDPFVGYMTEIRITHGQARYTTSTFTTPTAPFPRRRF